MQCYVRVHRSPLLLRIGQQVERRNHLRRCTFLSVLVLASLGVHVCERGALPFKNDCSGRSLFLFFAAKSDRTKGGTQASQPLTDCLPVAQKDMLYTYTPVFNSYSLLLELLIPQLNSPAYLALHHFKSNMSSIGTTGGSANSGYPEKWANWVAV